MASKATAAQAFGSTFAGPRSNYRISKTATGVAVEDNRTGISVDLIAPTSLQFADVSVNLQMGDLSNTISAGKLQTLIELYVAFFNRLPEADGLAYWIGQYKAGMSLDAIADSFYAAAVQYASLTGYSSSMSHADFVRIIYANVLGRSGSTAPSAEEVNYWAGQLSGGGSTRGAMLTTMLWSAHTFEYDTTWSWVSQLLDNKVTVAQIFAIEQGLGYNTPAESIAQGKAIAAAVTPGSINAAYNLIGITDIGFNLRIPYDPSPQLDTITPITPTAVMANTDNTFTVTGQDLPATAVLILGDTPCQTQAGSNTSTSFSAVCPATAPANEPTAAPISETAMVRTDVTQADGGLLINQVPVRTCAAHLTLINGVCLMPNRLLPLMTDSYGSEVSEADFGGGDSDASGADGTAGDGAPIANAQVTLVDKVGKVVTTTTDAQGYYRLSIKGMTPPFVASVIRPDRSTWQTTHPGPIKPRGFITANLTGLTDKITSEVLLDASANSGSGLAQRAAVAQAIRAEGVSAVGGLIARLTPSELEILLKAARKQLNEQLSAQLTQLGLNVVKFDPVTTPFKAVLSDPYDQLLETVAVTKDPATGTTTVVVVKYTLGGTVRGLTGSALVLTNNGQTVTINGSPDVVCSPSPGCNSNSFVFPSPLSTGTAYNVTVKTQPAGQTCTVSSGSGNVAAAVVSNVVVNCVSNAYTLGGGVSGLAASGLVLASNGQTVSVPANASSFGFASKIAAGSSYNVTVQTQPSGKTCTVRNGSGIMPAANVTNVAVTCTNAAYTLGGTVSGNTSALVLNADGQTVTVPACLRLAPGW